jgi:hypothetical protein
MTVESELILQFRGRTVSSADVAFIGQLIATHPHASRRRLSALLCEAWNWRQPNGRLKDMLCRTLMVRLHRQGYILLPAKRREAINNVVARRTCPLPPSLPLEHPPLAMSLPALGPLEIRQVRRTPQEGLFGALMNQHHYLGYTPPVGEHLK